MAQRIVVIYYFKKKKLGGGGGSNGVCSQGHLNSLFIIFMKHANIFRVPY